MICPDCGWDISGREYTCPNCKRTLRESKYNITPTVPPKESEIDLLKKQVEYQKIQIEQKEKELQLLKAIGEIGVINTQHTMYQSALELLRGK